MVSDLIPPGYTERMRMTEAIRAARTRSRLSLRALAAKAGTSHATLAAYEAGRVAPSVDTAERIVRAAGFELQPELVRRIRGDERLPRGEELRQALELAEMFPARHEPELTFPRFGPRVAQPA